VKLGAENRKELIVAAVLGLVLVVILIYEFMPSSSTIASTTTGTVAPLALQPSATPGPARGTPRRGAAGASGKKPAEPQNLDPMLHLDQLAASEQIKYEGTGRNIFVAQQADVEIPKVIARANTDNPGPDGGIYQPPTIAQSPPIPLKFFGFANQPGEPKRIFLVKGEDVFIAGEGEIVDRRYKVIRISPTSVDIQDVVQSGPPQSIPLTQG
jgi:hypothetical protein